MTLLHGHEFGTDAAAGTLLGLAALTAFVVAYGHVGMVAGPARSLLCGWAAFLVAVAALNAIEPPLVLSLGLVGACFALGLRALPPAPPARATAAPPWWDLPGRALAALSLVLGLTAVSGALGPHLSGLLAPFPILTSVLAVFSHAHDGFAAVAVLLRNFVVGFYGFAAFCFALAIALQDLSTAAAFGIATAAALTVQAAIVGLRWRLAAAPSTT
ncbi:MAG TPA: hypothetical protein VFY04_02040 [Solirubrobacterales bacterium]|nr:hypothetical protein [Solirubrobacterales bacterium]